LSSCTYGCTTKGGAAHAETVEALAAALLSLSAADRARLAALLTGHQGDQAEGKGATP
jgi:hypothetical protein